MENVDGNIVRLANQMVIRKRQKQPPHVLLLGAGASVESGLPSGGMLSDGLSPIFGVESNQNLYDQLQGAMRDSATFYAILKSSLGERIPSIGYHYLAYLVASGYFNIIFTTNWDDLLETALAKQLKYSDFKVLVRGEIDDQRIVDFLKYSSPRVKVVKLHGDLESRVFDITNKDICSISNNIVNTLKEQYFSQDTIIVGHSINDADIQSALRGPRGVLWYVSPTEASDSDFLIRAMNARNCRNNCINSTFDQFFLSLGLKAGRFELDCQELLTSYSGKIIHQLEKGKNYLDVSTVREAVTTLCANIRRARYEPDLIVWIHDPDAPGGSEVAKWIERQGHFQNAKNQQIQVVGRGAKLCDRQAKEISPIFDNIGKILLVDSIAFSGRTALLTAKRVREAYGDVSLKLAFLVVAKSFREKVESGVFQSFTREDIFFTEETERMEIFFPWGWTHSTENTVREFPVPEEKYQVCIWKRPWGTLEVFRENAPCSVKLLTIDAGQCLSKQRHISRDEFFIPLDDNIGLEIEGERFVIEKGDYIVIPRGVWHRIYAYKNSGRVLEIGLGFYDQVHDIERAEDKYGRESQDGRH